MQCASVVCPGVSYFSSLFHKRLNFRKKVTGPKMCVLIYSANLLETFLILRRNERDRSRMYIGLHVKYPLLLSGVNET